ncbi:phosphatidylglycerophosphatase A family protein [Robbsia andropogonis]|uniref:phosphatidylglycerophosphatase A family protein n=1 Tax=Robbsia andropogonis TaxID=28092 RepID=UPI003D201747
MQPDPTLSDTQARVERQPATLRFMLSHPVHIASLGFGSGLSPIMPGTCGTLFGWAEFAVLQPWLSNTAWALLILIGFLAGIGFCGFTARRMNVPDPGPVVWDEVIAIWLVLWLAAPTGFAAQLLAFAVFRFFDMVKPPPIRWFDQRLKGGFGIMFDDIVAAFFALLVLAIGHRLFG